MKLPKNITVRYDGGEVLSELDDKFEEMLKTLGYKRWASGVDMVDDQSKAWRDIAFERKE